MNAITRLALHSGVELWQVDLEAPLAAGAASMLSPDEQARASRFKFERDRDRFVAAHLALRQVLALHVGVAMQRLEFNTGAWGKPALADHPALPFNLSHSGGIALIAVGTANPIGVDVELERPIPDWDALASDYFAPAERTALAALRANARDRAFLTCWTRKEACLKAIGLGLNVAPRSVEVGIWPIAASVRVPTPDGTAQIAINPIAPSDAIAAAIGSLAQWQLHAPIRSGRSRSASPTPRETGEIYA